MKFFNIPLYLIFLFLYVLILTFLLLKIENEISTKTFILFYSLLFILFYLIIYKNIYLNFLKPFKTVDNHLKKFFETKVLENPIPLVGDNKVKKFISLINKIVLELQTWRGFRLNQIMEEKNKAQAIIDIIPDAVLLLDEKGEILYYNSSLASLISLEKKEEALNILKDIKDKDFLNQIQILLLENKDYAYKEFDYKKNNKSYIYLIITKKFELSTLNKKGIVYIFRDITKQKEFENAKDDFFHMITHDMRSPISTIEGYLVMLYNKTEKDEETEKYFQKIFYSSKKLKGMIEDILNFKKLKNAKAVLNLTLIDIQDLIENVVQEHIPMAKARNINIFFNKSLKKNEFWGDENLLERTLSNLISNSIKFTPKNGEINISFKDEKDFISFSVSDTGVGIPKDKKDLIFEKYITYDNISGFGIGLSLCKLVVELHKGKIWVDSKENKGTTFTFTISKHLKGGISNEKNIDNR